MTGAKPLRDALNTRLVAQRLALKTQRYQPWYVFRLPGGI